jgi:GH15 family glucan-1,4-alpha-glucosidase
VYNSCCMELAERDLEQVMEQGEGVFGLDAEFARWNAIHAGARFIPGLLNSAEQAVYAQSLITILQAMVREPGGGFGQILSGLDPRSRAVCVPADHLLAVRALAAAGMGDAVHEALRFVHNAEHRQYTLFDVYGNERGVGYPYLVPPVPWDGSGSEWRWDRADQATLRFDGSAWYIEAVDALRGHERNLAITSGRSFDDSAWVLPWWGQLSAQVADILTYRLDSAGLLRHDDSPWGSGLSDLPSVHGTVRAIHALDIAARYADWMKDDLKSFLYRDAARRSREGVHALLRRVMSADRPDALGPVELRVFHPLLCDAVTLGLVEAGSEEASFLLDMIETSFAVDGEPLHYNARPDGDWFERQVRPQIALRLCRAYVAAGKHERAEALLAAVTALATSQSNVLPELYDPVTRGRHGARPSVAAAAEYILSAESILLSRMSRKQD